MRPHPHLYEINARPFLGRLASSTGQPVSLGTIPDRIWSELRGKGFDLIWLMGVWQRSSAARQLARSLPGLRQQYDETLPGWTNEDVGGSPYAVYSYSLDPALGEQPELSGLHNKLNALGMGLILDFVPNHLALDHPWVQTRPNLFVPGTGETLRLHPDWYFSPDGSNHLAHGRDPYFPPWTDTAQVNFFSAELREALIGELLAIAQVADGVRCDMAMLGLNAIFQRVWGDTLPTSPRPATEFWDEAIARVRARHPSFIFIAEVYWNLEQQMQQLGFDFTYDKALYDHLSHSGATAIRSHLESSGFDGKKSVRFIENHDELRAAQALGRERSRAAATVIATLPGLRFCHDGQLEGHRARMPVQLIRGPGETPDAQLTEFYQRLLPVADAPVFHAGNWQLVDTFPAWPGNESHRSLLAWSWAEGDELALVVVNYSSGEAQGRVRLRLPPGVADPVALADELNGLDYVRGRAELESPGLYVALAGWGAHIFRVR